MTVGFASSPMGSECPGASRWSQSSESLDLTSGSDALKRLLVLIQRFEPLEACPGLYEQRYLQLVQDGTLDGFLREEGAYDLYQLSIPIAAPLSREEVKASLRSHRCNILVDNVGLGRKQDCCSECRHLARNLSRKIVPEADKDEFAKLRRVALERKARSLSSSLKLSKLGEKEQVAEIRRLIQREGISVDYKMEEWLWKAATDQSQEDRHSSLSPLSALFLREQVKANRAAGASGRRWHPSLCSTASLCCVDRRPHTTK
jgi:hypothetical protein